MRGIEASETLKAMTSLRERIRRAAPNFAREAVAELRARLGPAPYEELVLHPYAIQEDASRALRLSLVVPTLAPNLIFGGIATGVELFLEIGKQTGAQLRIVLDNFERQIDQDFIERAARRAGLDPAAIAIRRRSDSSSRYASALSNRVIRAISRPDHPSVDDRSGMKATSPLNLKAADLGKLLTMQTRFSPEARIWHLLKTGR
jgi:hypothetical protein